MTAIALAAAATVPDAPEHPDYPMRRWVFEDSAGRYDIDLGDSHVECGTLAQLDLPADLQLGYGTDRGTPQLVELVAGRYGDMSPGADRHVLITHGAQEALYLLYATLLQPGDRVVAFRPGWQQAWDAPRRLRCDVRIVELAEDFSLDLDALTAVAETPLRLITLNTPGNPTGRAVRADELAAIVRIAERHNAYVVVDEEYSLDLATSPAVRNERLISVSSLSKVAGLPGLRIGWMYGPPDVVNGCAAYKHLTSISNSVLCEALAAKVLTRWEHYTAQYRRLVRDGHRQLEDFAAAHARAVQLVPPEGTPFAWLYYTAGESSLSFARRVLDTGVLVMPAETFGARSGVRISFAREPRLLADGLRRIASALTTQNADANAPRAI